MEFCRLSRYKETTKSHNTNLYGRMYEWAEELKRGCNTFTPLQNSSFGVYYGDKWCVHKEINSF